MKFEMNSGIIGSMTRLMFVLVVTSGEDIINNTWKQVKSKNNYL